MQNPKMKIWNYVADLNNPIESCGDADVNYQSSMLCDNVVLLVLILCALYWCKVPFYIKSQDGLVGIVMGSELRDQGSII
jgi:uncharacterized Tic20 family protein